MRVKMIRFGGIAREPFLAGRIYDVAEELGRAMISDGRAIPADDFIEAAVKGPRSNTAKRTGKIK